MPRVCVVVYAHAYSFSSVFRRAAPLSTLMLSCSARSTISLRLRDETLCATSAAYLEAQSREGHV